MQKRLALAKEALKDMFEYFDNGGGQIGILDATNSSRSRRDMVTAECRKKGVDVFWVESLCEDADTIETNIRGVKVKLPEYSHMPVEEAVRDFKERIEHYRTVYETLDPDGVEKDDSFIQIKDLGRRFFVSRPQGILPMRIVRYLMNVHIRPRSIYLTRHGESVHNKSGKLGGDSGLSPAGLQYSRALKVFMNDQKVDDLKVWTSTLKRTVQTSIYFQGVESFKALDELDAGECDNLTMEEIGQRHPKVIEGRSANKFHYRYPRGESYRDVVERLEPMIVELERQENVLVITHQAICRCLLAYFENIPQEELVEQLPYLEVPLHTVIKVTPYNGGCSIEHFAIGPSAVNTHVPRGPVTPTTPGTITLGANTDGVGKK